MLKKAALVDLFPHTPNVEFVGLFERLSPEEFRKFQLDSEVKEYKRFSKKIKNKPKPTKNLDSVGDE